MFQCISLIITKIKKEKKKDRKKGGLRVGVSKGHDSWLPGASLATLASEPCWLTVALVTQHAFALHPDLWRRLQTPALKIASIKSIYIAEYALQCKNEKKNASQAELFAAGPYILHDFTPLQPHSSLAYLLSWGGLGWPLARVYFH